MRSDVEGLLMIFMFLVFLVLLTFCMDLMGIGEEMTSFTSRVRTYAFIWIVGVLLQMSVLIE